MNDVERLLKQGYHINTTTLYSHRDILLNYYSPDSLLKAVLNLSYDLDQSEHLAKQIELANYAISHNANVNIAEYGNSLLDIYSNSPNTNPKLIQLIKNNGAQCGIDAWVTKNIIWRENFYKYELSVPKLTNQIIRNLAIRETEGNKIPYILHHIWFTHPSSPREILQEEIDIVVSNNRLIDNNSQGKWAHVVWSNDKSLIPNSLAKLKHEGIETRSIEDYKHELRLFDQIIELISRKSWGLASDLARYSIIEKFGGVYCDLNYKLNRDIRAELHKYDFFAQSFINNIFGAKPEHPIMTTLVDGMEENLIDPPLYLSVFQDDMFSKTVFLSLISFGLAYLKSSNRKSNTDIIYANARACSYRDCEEDYNNNLPYPLFVSYAECPYLTRLLEFDHEIGLCLTNDHLLGQDNFHGIHRTWMDEM